MLWEFKRNHNSVKIALFLFFPSKESCARQTSVSVTCQVEVYPWDKCSPLNLAGDKRFTALSQSACSVESGSEGVINTRAVERSVCWWRYDDGEWGRGGGKSRQRGMAVGWEEIIISIKKQHPSACWQHKEQTGQERHPRVCQDGKGVQLWAMLQGNHRATFKGSDWLSMLICILKMWVLTSISENQCTVGALPCNTAQKVALHIISCQFSQKARTECRQLYDVSLTCLCIQYT